jgi:hypothetical protein
MQLQIEEIEEEPKSIATNFKKKIASLKPKKTTN